MQGICRFANNNPNFLMHGLARPGRFNSPSIVDAIRADPQGRGPEHALNESIPLGGGLRHRLWR
jgi:hypothetical protein